MIIDILIMMILVMMRLCFIVVLYNFWQVCFCVQNPDVCAVDVHAIHPSGRRDLTSRGEEVLVYIDQCLYSEFNHLHYTYITVN